MGNLKIPKPDLGGFWYLKKKKKNFNLFIMNCFSAWDILRKHEKKKKCKGKKQIKTHSLP